MKSISLLIFSLLALQIYSQNVKYSITRDDNDFVTYKDVHSIKELNPPQVIEKFKEILASLKGKTCNFYSYKIKVNNEILLFSLLINYDQQTDCHIIAFNNLTKTITPIPVKLNMKWSFNNEHGFNQKLLDYPLIKITKENDKYILTLKQRVHNGNAYNAVIKKLYELSDDCVLSLRYCYESVSLTFDDQKIVRLLNNDTIFVYKHNDNTIEYLGKLVIDPRSKEITSREFINQEYDPILFTMSGENEEEILRNGYLMKY